jgi:hypothetical protein
MCFQDVDRQPATDGYIRLDQSNFPGRYDFLCPNSRVTWGCVLTIHSLEEAKAGCNAEARCKAFVLFTSNPSTDCEYRPLDHIL